MSLDPLSAVTGLADTIIKRIWPDKSEQERQQMAQAFMVIQGQLDANKEEAKHENVFVSGWRPFIGWVCGSGCAWNWIGLPIAKFVAVFFGQDITLAPADLSEMMPLLLGMLGLGALRTVEKVQGVARS